MKSREEMHRDQRWAARAAYAQHAVLTEPAGIALDAAIAAWEQAKWQYIEGGMMLEPSVIWSEHALMWQYRPEEPQGERQYGK